MYNTSNLNRQKLYAIVAISALLVVAFIGWIIYELTSARVELNVAPEELTVVVGDGKSRDVKRGDNIKLRPGVHTLTFSRQGFSTKVVDVRVSLGEDKTIAVALEPTSASARDYYRDDADSKVIYEGSHSGSISDSQKKFEKANPHFAQLPFNYREYSAYICPSLKHPNDDLKRAVCVDLAVPQVRDMTIKSLEKQGFDFTRDEIYISSNPTVRQIHVTDNYRVEYSHDIKTDKPVFLINISTRVGSVSEQHAQIVSDLKSIGYNPSDFMVAYANREFTDYNSDRYINYPDNLR